ncbi:beta-ketoacyl-ACP synthase [Escherichia coli]|nr:beta-ketoacyl-ACP synthase [Escherichia coli]
MTRRVVITGMGGVTAFGENWQDVSARLLAYENAVRKMPEWQVYDGLHTLLGAPVDDFTLPEHYTRKRIRAMGRVSQMSTRASELALEQAGLIGDPILTSGETGIAYGSSTGSTGPVSEFATMLTEKHTNNITGTTYVQMMPHTTAVNTGLFFGLRGRVIPTSSACTSGSQAIGYAWEAIRHGYQTVMVAGGAEELCPSEAAVFDTLFATSQHNDAPKTTPSPFDENRDGLVIGEGAGTLILEELEHAKARGATIYGDNVPLSSLKSYFGHTLGACGALEAWMSLQMMREGWFAPTLNLNKPDPNCGALDYIMHEARKVDCEFLQSNNFAFGGINTSIIIKRWP